MRGGSSWKHEEGEEGRMDRRGAEEEQQIIVRSRG